MKKTVFIAGPLPQAGALYTALTSHHLYVVVLGNIEDMEEQVSERLFPHLTILWVTGNRDKDIPFITQVELYPEDRKKKIILISPSSLKYVKHRLFYKPYSRVSFIQPIDVAEVAQTALEMLH